MTEFRAKDFVQTADSLLFAVVADGLEQGKVLCFLRYIYLAGQWQKVDTETANALLRQHYPDYLHFSEVLSADLHAVEAGDVKRHFRPQVVLQELLTTVASDAVTEDLQKLCHLLEANSLDIVQFGVTGSILVGMQNHASDIDLVCFEREVFHQARNVIQAMIAQDKCQALNDQDWLSAYQRRACDFALDDYIWHEQRKYNKAIFNQRKFDLSLVAQSPDAWKNTCQKQGAMRLVAEVSDDRYAFDYPAVFKIKHPEIQHVACFTATYIGQAKTGETIEVAGQLEIDDSGRRRILVGSNREAIGEFIRVVR